ncbi:MAG: type II toxin-antitoxin system Phd/YefM family antitoxin [Rhodanobacter sp.]|nr:MAG: type II toxin-antitoxin system Phd/YefM family antitoxin [Rhodanobacter sp.]TAL93226.1 MAG: type II toxin-antitoxin system Phd/YefM family antitoxin [Rhodanobacter sp.]TAM38380.1 MAG: type II toxin-antitoxin system Phd/YefM family antitoxin [Rhodanobacter sp.]TAN27867.1 MAG: type II toxin-antitoxin system Phd/YefM family antitoxin [Rhodanobacter sp.]
MSEHILSLSDFKADASQLLKRMREHDATPLVLTQNGRASAVVQNYDEYQQLQKSLAMMKLIAMGEADIAAGKLVPQEQVFAKARAQLAAYLKSDG